MKPWIVPLLVAVVLWGVAAFLRKKAIAFLPPQSAVTFEVLGAVIVILFLLVISGGHMVREPKGAFFGVLAGFAAVAGTFFIFRALQTGPVTIVTPFTALAVVVTVVLGMVFLQEKLLPHHVLGIIMGIAAAILLSF